MEHWGLLGKGESVFFKAMNLDKFHVPVGRPLPREYIGGANKTLGN